MFHVKHFLVGDRFLRILTCACKAGLCWIYGGIALFLYKIAKANSSASPTKIKPSLLSVECILRISSTADFEDNILPY